MAEPFGVDLDRLSGIVERMAHYQVVVDSMLDEIDTVVVNAHHNWDGAASRAHAEAHDQWKAGAQVMGTALRQLQAAVAHAHGVYHSAIETNASIWA